MKLTKKILSIVLSVLMIFTTMPLSAMTAFAAGEDHYLLAYFKGNDKANTSGTDQTIRFAVSTDGYNYEAIYGGNKVINQTIGTGNARDPYIFKGQDGYFYCIATDADCSSSWWGNSQTMILWRSTDLINWKDGTIINMQNKIGKDTWRCWAPEVFWNGSEYVVYFALAAADYTDNGTGDNTHMYYCTTTDLLNQDAYSTPKLLISNSNKDNIDGDIAVYNGKYYLFYKDETNATICVIRSDVAPSSGLTEAPFDYNNNVKLNAGSSVGALEGCEVFQDNSGNYIFMADRFSSNGNFAMYNLGNNLDAIYDNATTSGGVLTYNLPSQVSHNLTTSNPTGVSPRHGSVVKVTAAQYNALKTATEFTTTYSVNGEKHETTVANGYDENLIARYFTSSNVTTDTASGKYTLSKNGNGASWDANMYGGSGAAYFTPDNYMSNASAGAMFTESKNGKTIQANGLTVSFLGKTSSSNDANGRFFEFNKSGLKNSHTWGNTSTPSRYITMFAANGLQTEISYDRETGTYTQDGSVMSGSNSSVSTVDAWHQYTLTIDGNKTTVFVDGVKAYEMLLDNTQNIIADIASSGYLLIGACCWPDNTFTGYIRDFRVYNFGARDDEAARIASEINNDYAFDQMQTAISNFETKMSSGKAYTNMTSAYDAYVALNAAYDAFNYGKDSSVDLASKVNALCTATDSMKEWTPTKGNAVPVFDASNTVSSTNAYANLLYSSNVNSGKNCLEVTSGTWGEVNKTKNQIGYNATVMMWDGVTTPKMPVMHFAQFYRDGWKSKDCASYGAFPLSDSTISNDHKYLKLTEMWHSNKSSDWKFDTKWTSTSYNIGYSSTTMGAGPTFAPSRNSWGNWCGYSNVLQFGNYVWGDAEYSKAFNNLNWGFYYERPGKTATSELLSSTGTANADAAIYVVNIVPLKNALNTAVSSLPTVTNYKEGGLSSVLTTINDAASYNPNTARDGASNAAGVVTKFETDVKAKVSSLSSLPAKTADKENQYIAVRALLDNADIIAAYNDGVNTNYTSKSFNNFVAKYNAAITFMSKVDTEKYANGTQAETVANELQAAYDSLETVKASITFENLFSFDDFYNSSSASATTSNGTATYNRTAKTITVTGSGDNYTDHSNLSTVYKIPVTAGHTYYLEFTADNVNADAMVFVPNEDESGFDSAYTGFRGGHVNGHNRMTINVPDGKKYVYFRFGSTNAENVTVNFSNIVFYDSEREAARGNLTDLGVTEISVTPGQPYGELPTPEREGYSFGGWFTDTTFTKQITAETTAVNDQYATVLYAKWDCPHTKTTTVGKKNPTCTEKGNTGTTTCDACGAVIKEATEIPANGHQFTSAQVIPETCTTDGETYYVCADCGVKDETTVQVRPKTGHDFTGAIESTNNDGTHNVYCANDCGETEEVACSYTEKVTDPTCTAQGYTTYTCECGYKYTDNYTGPSAHTYTNYVYNNDATCTKDGTETATCDVCKTATDTRTAVGTATNVHTYSKYVYNNDATCTKAGTMTATCDVCKTAKDTKDDPAYPATGHNFTGAIASTNNDGTHNVYCANNCGETEKVACSYTENVTDPTCTAQGYTTHTCECGYKYTDNYTGPSAHTYTDYVYNNDATCTKAGTMTATCDVCKTAKDTKDDPAHPATGHSFTNYVYNNDATLEADGTETAECDNGCGETDTRTAEGTQLTHVHTPAAPVNENYVLPTREAEGSYDEVIYCTADDCDAPGKVISREHKTIPMLSDDQKPNNSASLTLNEAVDFNFYIDTPYYAKDLPEDAKNNLVYEVAYQNHNSSIENGENGETVIDTVEVENTTNRTLIKVKTAPAQLTEVITITLKVKDADSSVTVINDYSMKSYCDQVIDYNMKSAAVCKELIKYAATAQVNFKYNEANMADVVDEAFKSELDADYNAVKDTVSATSNVQQASNDDFKITGVSYVALADTTIRFYLDKTNPELYAATGYTYGKCDISAVTMEDQKGSRTYEAYFAQNADGKVYIAVAGIESANLDNAFTFTVTTPSGKTTTVTYSATAFCKSAVVNGKDTLKDLAKAIVLYNVAADKVFE